MFSGLVLNLDEFLEVSRSLPAKCFCPRHNCSTAWHTRTKRSQDQQEHHDNAFSKSLTSIYPGWTLTLQQVFFLRWSSFYSSSMRLNDTYHDLRILTQKVTALQKKATQMYYAPYIKYWPTIDPKSPESFVNPTKYVYHIYIYIHTYFKYTSYLKLPPGTVFPCLVKLQIYFEFQNKVMVSRKNLSLDFPNSTAGYEPYIALFYSMASPLFDFQGHTTSTTHILFNS